LAKAVRSPLLTEAPQREALINEAITVIILTIADLRSAALQITVKDPILAAQATCTAGKTGLTETPVEALIDLSITIIVQAITTLQSRGMPPWIKGSAVLRSFTAFGEVAIFI